MIFFKLFFKELIFLNLFQGEIRTLGKLLFIIIFQGQKVEFLRIIFHGFNFFLKIIFQGFYFFFKYFF